MTEAEFLDQCATSAEELALFFAGAPTDQMMKSLEQVRANLAVRLAEALGPEAAAELARDFVAAVVGRRREIEMASPLARA